MRSRWDRRVIPRWRSSGVSASLLESMPTKTGPKPTVLKEGVLNDLAAKVRDWSENPRMGVAADLLNFAHLRDANDLLIEPARYLIALGEDLPPQLSAIAAQIVGGQQQTTEGWKDIGCQREISRLRKLLAVNPRDAIALIDMARFYAALGQNERADRAVSTAVALQPHHRFILRSASRFFVHNGDPEQALHILNKSARTKGDPWLLASHIAIETILERSPTQIKRARTIIESYMFSPQHLSELGVALATLHVNSGQMKIGKKLFNQALVTPNDNAVAQAVWAATEFSMPINIRPEWLSDRFSFEANYYALSQDGRYQEALKAAVGWFEDEPFSSRPLRGAAFSASVLGRYTDAEDCLRQALMLDPGDIECQNNLVFALAGQNRLAEAAELLSTIRQAESERGSLSGHTLANIGMFFYRSGDIDLGRQYYGDAVTLLDSQKKRDSKDLASAFWVREAQLSGDPKLPEILTSIKPALQKSDSPAAKAVLTRTLKGNFLEEESSSESSPIIRSAIKWEHDAKRNVLLIQKKDPFGSKKN